MVTYSIVRRLEEFVAIGNAASRHIECQLYVHGKDPRRDDPDVLVYITRMSDIDNPDAQNPRITDIDGNAVDDLTLRARIVEYVITCAFQRGADLRVLATALENERCNIAYAAPIAEFVEEGVDDAAAWLALQPEDAVEEASIALGKALRGYHRYFNP